MKFLQEVNESVETVIEEGANGKKSMYISGIFAQAEIGNRNRRIYPKGILEKQIDNQQKLIKENRALGELNHPNTPNVSLDRVSHMITELKWDGNNVLGKAKILESVPMGQIAAGLLNDGVKFGVSTRGMGSLKQTSNGLQEVQSDFRMVCVDIVSDPSGPECWVEGLYENASWVLDPVDGLWKQQAVESIQKEINTTKKLTLEQKTKLFKKYLNILSN